VTTVDLARGKISIDHDDIPGYMSPMSMTEPVSDKAMLSAVRPGDRVAFEIERTGADIVITPPGEDRSRFGRAR